MAGRTALVSRVVALTRWWKMHIHTINMRRPQLVYKHTSKRISLLFEQCCVPGKATRVCRSPAKTVNEVSLPWCRRLPYPTLKFFEAGAVLWQIFQTFHDGIAELLAID